MIGIASRTTTHAADMCGMLAGQKQSLVNCIFPQIDATSWVCLSVFFFKHFRTVILKTFKTFYSIHLLFIYFFWHFLPLNILVDLTARVSKTYTSKVI